MSLLTIILSTGAIYGLIIYTIFQLLYSVNLIPPLSLSTKQIGNK